MTALSPAAVMRSRWSVAALAVAAASAAGSLAALNQPLMLIGLLGMGLGLALFAGVGARLPGLFLGALTALLLGYAFLGRGFAYLGMPPLFVGEMVFALGLLAVLARGFRTRLSVVEWLLLAFIGWGALTTIPYLPTYGIDAMRDAAFWGYSLFALAVAAFVTRESQFRRIVSGYALLLPAFVLWVPIFRLSIGFLATAVPRIPGSTVQLFNFKPGDMGVHLAAVAAFMLLGLYASTRRAWPQPVIWSIWLVALIPIVAFSRSGMLAATAGLTAVIVLRPSMRLIPLAGIVTVVLGLALLTNPSVSIGNRPISPNGIATSFMSIFTDNGARQGTKDWRLEWWGTIFDYTVRGPYLVTGKGFGVNLAIDDGFEVQAGGLRSPHNGHMTALARMGVPGFSLWVLLHGAFAFGLLRAFIRARRRGSVFWAGVDGWLFVFWLAAMVNGAFDVYFEGPQGAIWLWTVIGLGIAAMRIQAAEERALPPPRAARRPAVAPARLEGARG